MANDFTAMLVGRTTQGIGGGGIILMNDILITDLVPLILRGPYFGIIVVGGALAYKANWVSRFSESLRV